MNTTANSNYNPTVSPMVQHIGRTERSPMVQHIGRTESEFTADEARALVKPSVSRKHRYIREERGWGCTDLRTKDAKRRIREKHEVKFYNNRLRKYIANIEKNMQKILETQDPTKEGLYEQFAERKAFYESKFITQSQE